MVVEGAEAGRVGISLFTEGQRRGPGDRTPVIEDVRNMVDARRRNLLNNSEA